MISLPVFTAHCTLNGAIKIETIEQLDQLLKENNGQLEGFILLDGNARSSKVIYDKEYVNDKNKEVIGNIYENPELKED